MAATHGGILYYVVKVPKEARWVTARSIELDSSLSTCWCDMFKPLEPEIHSSIKKKNKLPTSQRTHYVRYKDNSVNDVWGTLFIVGIIRGTYVQCVSKMYT
jgi:hypothetical protein